MGIAGIAIESSTFSPHRTGLSDFTVTRGDDLLARYSWITGPRPRPAWPQAVEWVPLLPAVALPGGPVLASTYAALKTRFINRLAPPDGLLLDIHGAIRPPPRRLS